MASMMRTASVTQTLSFLTICAIMMWLQEISRWWIWLPSHYAKKTTFLVQLDALQHFLRHPYILQLLLTKFTAAAVVVFNLNKPGNIAKATVGERVGTLIRPRSQQQRSEGGVVGHEFVNDKWLWRLKVRHFGLNVLRGNIAFQVFDFSIFAKKGHIPIILQHNNRIWIL